MQILKSCNLLSITDTCLNQRLFIFFIIGMQNGFFLNSAMVFLSFPSLPVIANHKELVSLSYNCPYPDINKTIINWNGAVGWGICRLFASILP